MKKVVDNLRIVTEPTLVTGNTKVLVRNAITGDVEEQLGGGGGSTPLATDFISGTVKTDILEANPVVYTKSSVDELITQALGGQLSYFFFKTASDIGGYFKMLLNPSTGVSQDITALACTGTVTIASFITEPNAPNKTYVPKGYFNSLFHAKKTGAGNAKVFFEIYIRNLAGVETLVGTSTSTDTFLTTSILEYNLRLYVPVQISLLATDRIVYRFKTVVSTGTPDVGIYFEDSYLTGLDVPSYIVSVGTAPIGKKLVYEFSNIITGVTVTGTTSNTLVYAHEMPVDLLSSNGVIEYEFRASRNGTITANSASNIYLNSSASLTGAIKIGTRGTGTIASQKNMSQAKKILFNETKVQITSPTIGGESDITLGESNFVNARQPLIVSENNFLILSFLNSDTTSISELFGVSIKIYK